MSTNLLQTDRGGTPPYVKPLLQTLDRLQERVVLRPEDITQRAQSLLATHFGQMDRPAEAAFAHGSISLMAGHTHFFDGFAFLMPLPHGTAVALREGHGNTSRLVFEGDQTVWSFDLHSPESDAVPTPPPIWVQVVIELLRGLCPEAVQVEVAAISTVPSGCPDAYLSALGVAVARAAQAAFALAHPTPTLLNLVRDVITDTLGLPFSLAYPMAAEAARPGTFTLIDTLSGEHLSMPAPPHHLLGWGLIDTGSGFRQSPAFYRKRKEQSEQALAMLQQRGFDQLTSWRDLEHRDLERALSLLPRHLRPLVRHLVTENRRVQKLTTAVRRSDWQMVGALLMMSHASLHTDWQDDTAAIECAVSELEAMSLEGMYGACVTGRSGSVVVVGQPFMIPHCLDHVKAVLTRLFGVQAETILL